MFIITFIRSGGLAGEEIDLRVDLNSLSIGESQHLLQLIEDADFFNLPGNMTSPLPAPDEFRYTITLDGSNRTRHSVHTSDSTAPVSLRPLIEELAQMAYAKPPQPK